MTDLPAQGSSSSGARPGLILGAALLLVFVQELAASRKLSATFDEQAHIAAGYAYVAAGDYRFNPEHPPLVKLLAGLAVATLPGPDLRETPAFAAGDQWALGAALLTHPGLAPWALLDRARIPTMLLGVLGAWLCYRLAASLHGRLAGLVALLGYAGWPELAGHGPLVTTDVPVMTFALGAVLAARRLRRRYTHSRALVLGLHVALCLMVKYSGPMLLVILGGLLVALPGRRPAPRDVARAAAVVAAVTVVVGLLAFQGASFFRIYPEGFRLALTREKASAEFPFYLLGSYAREGFWSYYVVAAALKTPLPLLLLLLWGGATLLRRRPTRDEAATLLFPLLAWLTLTALLAANIGLRYLLPAFPFLLAVAARTAAGADSRRAALAVALALASVATTAAAPDAVGYTNVLVRRGHDLAYLDMGCVDWGQGLRALERTLEERAAGPAPTLLWYQSPLDASALIPGTRSLPSLLAAVDPATGRLRAGRYAVSAHFLLRAPGARALLAESCGVEAPVGPSIYLFCCPPCREPALPEDDVLRIPLAAPPAPAAPATIPASDHDGIGR